jgi:phospholipase/carboxylesterase
MLRPPRPDTNTKLRPSSQRGRIVAGQHQGIVGAGDDSPADALDLTREAKASPGNRRTPTLFCHGTEDPLVPIARGRAAFQAHATAERDALWREFPIAHEVSDEEIAAARDWRTRG